jgi:glycine/D-amino acid oxidase-like deaminating enzyme
MKRATAAPSNERDATIAVLGAGLQGCCIALELAARGHDVLLLERDPLALNRASVRNEGKIHLGLLWAKDPSFASAQLQLEGALNFMPLLARWLGPAIDALRLSTPFTYLVARDSLVDPEALERHFAAVEEQYQRRLEEDLTLTYLGRRPRRLYRRMPVTTLETRFNTQRAIGGFETEELSVDTDQLAGFVRRAIAASPRIDFLPNRTIGAVARMNGSGFCITGSSPSGDWIVRAAQVVNATWESRIAIDHSAGLSAAAGWVHRLKYRVIATLPEHLRSAPSITIVLGPYGDVVVRPDGTAYLSWYPLGLRGWTHDMQPPAAWDAACRGAVTLEDEREFGAAVLRALDDWYPGVAQSQPLLIDAGAIVAYGRADVGSTSSGLHRRTAVGVTSVDGYHSVDPGKLTTAPLFTMHAVDRVLGGNGSSSVEA